MHQYQELGQLDNSWGPLFWMLIEHQNPLAAACLPRGIWSPSRLSENRRAVSGTWCAVSVTFPTLCVAFSSRFRFL